MRITIKLVTAVIKTLLAQLAIIVAGCKLVKDNIWIFGEKKTEARDNGYHFFRYINQNYPEIKAVYVINKGSADEPKVRQIGKVIHYDSFKHCMLYYAAKCKICSQTHGVRPFEEYPGLERIRFYRRLDQRHINLKHGISKDFRPDSFDYRKVGFDLYISGAKPEYDYIKSAFNYPDKNIALTGFCRFDALYTHPASDKTILIMPTFREWLRTSDSAKDCASFDEMKKFKESQYYKRYNSLLNNSDLVETARKNGYRILFYLHYTFQPYVSAFTVDQNCDVITICNRKDYDVQQLLLSTSMLITDFSSVLFDYGYMMKPMAFYQFDIEDYRSKHYQEGYFSYERDAFGPVIMDEDVLVDYVRRLFICGMKMDDIYQDRVKKFFVPHDNHNCDRVYEAILKLED